jgi:hypothetical protein
MVQIIRCRPNVFVLGSAKKQTRKYEDQERDRFCKETTYAAEYGKRHLKNDKYDKNVDNHANAKYSNRIPKSVKSQSMDKSKDHRGRDHHNRKSSQELVIVCLFSLGE